MWRPNVTCRIIPQSFNIVQLHVYIKRRVHAEWGSGSAIPAVWLEMLIDCPHEPVLIGKLLHCVVKVPRLTSRGWNPKQIGTHMVPGTKCNACQSTKQPNAYMLNHVNVYWCWKMINMVIRCHATHQVEHAGWWKFPATGMWHYRSERQGLPTVGVKPHIFKFLLVLPRPFSTVATTSHLFAAFSDHLSWLQFFSQLFSFFISSRLSSSLFTSSHLLSTLLNLSQLFSPLATSSPLLSPVLTSAQLISPLLSSSQLFSPLVFGKLFSTLHTSFHRDARRREILHTEAFTHKNFTYRSFYTEKLLHRKDSTQRNLYKEKSLQREIFTQRIVHTRKLIDRETLHSKAFTQRFFLHREAFGQPTLTQQLLHRETFTQRNLYYTEKLWHRQLLHTETFTQRNLYTEKVWHTADFCTEIFFPHSELLNMASFKTGISLQKLSRSQLFHTETFT